jgi:hypothetical protein
MDADDIALQGMSELRLVHRLLAWNADDEVGQFIG